MFRNQYDHDVIIFSPQGRIHQIEYAMEAVKQGSATVGVKNATHAALVALKRAPSELSSFQKKIIPIDSHIGLSIAGLTADGQVLSRFARDECFNHRWAYDSPLTVNRLVDNLASKLQVPTQVYGKRPFGVGLLIAGYDVGIGPRVFYQCPSANYYDCKSIAIGARSQSARTYLEGKLEEIAATTTPEELIKHGLIALRNTLPNEMELSVKNCSVALVGPDMNFTVYEDSAVEPYLALIREEPAAGEAETASGDDEGARAGSGAAPAAQEASMEEA